MSGTSTHGSVPRASWRAPRSARARTGSSAQPPSTRTASRSRVSIAHARDLARVGLLVLDRGRWKGQVLLDDEFLERALETSQAFNPSYGYLWWLPTEATALLSGGTVIDERKAFAGTRTRPSHNPFGAHGSGGGLRRWVSSVSTCPSSLGLTVVRLGHPRVARDPTGSTTISGDYSTPQRTRRDADTGANDP